MIISELVDQFLTYCEVEKNLSPKTCRLYSHVLKRFEDFAGEIPPQKITLDLVREYRLFLNRTENKRGQSLSQKAQAYHIIALRAFLKYLRKRDIETLAPEKIELPKSPQRSVSFLTREEIERLFKTVDLKNIQGLRDIAILETLYSTGLRVSELANLNRNQVDFKRREFMVRGKGRKPRIVFISENAVKRIEAYLKERNDSFDPLFLNHKRGSAQTDITLGERRRLTTYSIECMVKKYAMLSGMIKRVTPHTLRHSFATSLLQNGADIRSVQELLGHSSITTTQIYTHLTNRGLKETYEKFHG